MDISGHTGEDKASFADRGCLLLWLKWMCWLRWGTWAKYVGRDGLDRVCVRHWKFAEFGCIIAGRLEVLCCCILSTILHYQVEVISLSSYMSKLLSMQDNLLKASTAELLWTDTLRLTTKELHEHTVYLPATHVLVHCRTGSAHVLERSYECSRGFSSAFYYNYRPV